MIDVINFLKDGYELVQLGTLEEPRLPNTIDQRNICISDTAKLLAHSKFFIGQVGFLILSTQSIQDQ